MTKFPKFFFFSFLFFYILISVLPTSVNYGFQAEGKKVLSTGNLLQKAFPAARTSLPIVCPKSSVLVGYCRQTPPPQRLNHRLTRLLLHTSSIYVRGRWTESEQRMLISICSWQTNLCFCRHRCWQSGRAARVYTCSFHWSLHCRLQTGERAS